ncbi:hypothetical protein [Saprospira grandis]|uniref:hypothetical protein n=1 Tax=Saprospira grandis TaxID=1008 RepID=UPI0022DE1145|nr:hypothetical protein [Saprospira grandis]WBM74581.1 hypothetical protein OP864_16480 [Saprospira grandis]
MKQFVRLSLLMLIVFSLGSCQQRMVDFTIISTKNVDLSNAANFKKGKERVKGQDIAHIILVIPTGFPNLKEAIDRAIEVTPGAVALTDGVIYSKSFYFFLYGQNGYIVEGTPLIDPSLTSNEQEDFPAYAKVTYDKKGNYVVEELTEEEYTTYKKKFVPKALKSTI